MRQSLLRVIQGKPLSDEGSGIHSVLSIHQIKHTINTAPKRPPHKARESKR